jgi:5-methylcytosine-specific restriction endonuclease McrA
VLANYYIFKERDYERVRAINRKAVARKRFGVSSREEIFARDGHKCLVCGSAEKLVIHHKDHHGRGKEKPNNDPQNLMTVCTSCHAAHHFGHRKMKV